MEVCDVFEENTTIPDLSVESHAPEMVNAETKGAIQELGSEALKGLERYLLEYVVAKAEPGNPQSVLDAMDAFWNKTFEKTEVAEKWNVRGKKIEEMVQEIVESKTAANSKRPVRCLEM